MLSKIFYRQKVGAKMIKIAKIKENSNIKKMKQYRLMANYIERLSRIDT
jgi:hypothetical protein